ncbi:MAG: 4-(cytidine 5'-diphospho)-2-C-methyl-D-erythritol kinase [Gammaproteobacteria bacterium]|nr:4-(cytidine 5'-diphospho)-2-C-methyl-D-erythritol kinase [Gammaproteobacteria bacterium]
MSLADGWPAPAKLNLFLHVTGRRADGYHLVQTLLQFLDFGDRLHLGVRADGVIRRVGNPDLPAEDLAVRAARLLKAHARIAEGADIAIDKRIPPGAGLGGGSSDAATCLIVLNRLWRANLPRDDLVRLGARLGADVPVFLFGHAAFAEGIGDVLTAADPPEAWYVVVAPGVEVPTGTIFADPQLTRSTPVTTIRGFLAGETRNDLEPVTRRLFPEVDRVLARLGARVNARMTGSGGAVFATVDERAAGERILADLPNGWRGFVTRGVNRHPLADDAPVRD